MRNIVVEVDNGHYSYWCSNSTRSSPTLDEKCKFCGQTLVLKTALDELAQVLINAARNEVAEADVTNEETDWAYNRGITDAVNAMLAECSERGLEVE